MDELDVKILRALISEGAVDRAMLSHFKASYLTVQFSDPANGWVFASASTMADVQSYLE
jgi:hypothetical protein